MAAVRAARTALRARTRADHRQRRRRPVARPAGGDRRSPRRWRSGDVADRPARRRRRRHGAPARPGQRSVRASQIAGTVDGQTPDERGERSTALESQLATVERLQQQSAQTDESLRARAAQGRGTRRPRRRGEHRSGRHRCLRQRCRRTGVELEASARRSTRPIPPVSRLLRSNLTVAAGTTLSRLTGSAPGHRARLRARPDGAHRRVQPGQRDAEHRLRAAARRGAVGDARAAVLDVRRGRRRASRRTSCSPCRCC